MKNGTEIIRKKTDGVFVAIGLQPENTILDSLAEIDNYGYVSADERCITETPGLFVAGDCRSKKIRQISTAIADGAASALAAIEFIR